MRSKVWYNLLLRYCVKMFYNHTWIYFFVLYIATALDLYQCHHCFFKGLEGITIILIWKVSKCFFAFITTMMTRQYWMFIWSVMLRHGINSCQILFIRKDLQIDSLVTSIFAIWITAILLITQHLSNCCLAIMSVWNGYFIYLIFIK